MNHNNAMQYDFIYDFIGPHDDRGYSIFANEYEIIMLLNRSSPQLLLINIIENQEYRGEIPNYYHREKIIFNENFSNLMIISDFDVSIYNVKKVNSKLLIQNTKKIREIMKDVH